MGKKIILEDGTCVTISSESYNELKKSVNELRTPDNIVFERRFNRGDGLGIVFNDRTQVLCYDSGVYTVRHSLCSDSIKHLKLRRVSVDELKPGYTYYYADFEPEDFTDLSNYCKYLGNRKHAFVSYNSDVIVCECNWDYWYEVVDT